MQMQVEELKHCIPCQFFKDDDDEEGDCTLMPVSLERMGDDQDYFTFGVGEMRVWVDKAQFLAVLNRIGIKAEEAV